MAYLRDASYHLFSSIETTGTSEQSIFVISVSFVVHHWYCPFSQRPQWTLIRYEIHLSGPEFHILLLWLWPKVQPVPPCRYLICVSYFRRWRCSVGLRPSKVLASNLEVALPEFLFPSGIS